MVNRSLWLSSLRFMARHHWQTGLGFLGIALGVAIVVAVDLANASARKAFSLSLEALTGPASHQIVGPASGIDEQLFVQLRTRLGLTRSTPLLQARVRIQDQAFTFLGIDPVSELSLQRHRDTFGEISLPDLLQHPDGIAMARQTASRLQLEIGDRIAFRYRDKNLQARLVTVFDAEQQPALAGLVFTDIATAQHMLGRQRWIDRIDLQLNETEQVLLSDWLPPKYQLQQTDQRNHSLLAMTDAFHTNLTAMSLLALLVGALLIYNTMNFSALRRRAMIGTYRALGVRGSELFTLLLSEALLLALLASIAGVVLGWLLSQQLVLLVTRTIDDLYFSLSVNQFFVSHWSLLKGMGLGLGVTLVATLLPAWTATRVPAITLQRRSETERFWDRYAFPLAAAGAGLMVVGYLYSALPEGSVSEGFVAIALIAIGFCLLCPWLLLIGVRGALLLSNSVTGIQGRLALRGISSGISRTGVATAALAVAIATSVGVSIMVSSFRHSVDIWLQQSLSGDWYLSIPGSSRDNHDQGIPPSLIEQLAAVEGINRVATLRSWRVDTPYGRLRTVNISPPSAKLNDLLLSRIPDFDQHFEAGAGVLVSEPLSHHQRLETGDSIRLQTEKGIQAFPILGIYRDYSSSRGVIAIPTALLQQHWSVLPAVNSVVIHTRGGDNDMTRRIREVMQHYPGHYDLMANRQIRERSLVIFDRTFAITQVLRVLVLIVAFTGLLSALLALQLEKSREFALLRATGFSRGQLSTLIIVQTSLLGLFSALLSLPLGALLADRLIQVVNRRSFGWSMEQIFPFELLPQTLLLAVFVALCAGLYPAWKINRADIAPAMREE